MRPLLLFSPNVLVPLLITAYIVFMLSLSCLPISDSDGQLHAIPRWEYWLLYASYPSAMMLQWTGGEHAFVWWDRIPVFVGAVLWLATAWTAGRLVCRCDSSSCKYSFWLLNSISVLVGHSALSSWVFLHGACVGTRSFFSLVLSVLAALVLLYWIGVRTSRSSERPSSLSAPVANVEGAVIHAEAQATWLWRSTSLYRRLVGLLVLAFLWLTSFQIYGASIPATDKEVRETTWWLAKHSMDEGHIRWHANNVQANEPLPQAMPILACMQARLDHLTPTNRPHVRSIEMAVTRRQIMLEAALTGKVINAFLCLVGILIVAVHSRWQWGYLVGAMVAFLLIATPGGAELIRLGRSECLLGVWLAALVVWVCHGSRTNDPNLYMSEQSRSIVAWLLLTGIASLGYVSALFATWIAVGALGCFWGMKMRRTSSSDEENTAKSAGLHSSWLGRSVLIVITVVVAASVPMRNAIVVGAPFAPWCSRMSSSAMELAESASMMRHERAVPGDTLDELLRDAESGVGQNGQQRPERTQYRFVNVLDGLKRIFWDSNVHGLALIPFALIGMIVNLRFFKRLDVVLACWVVTSWVFVWWIASPRLDREWVGALWLMGFPAATGIYWLVSKCHRYWLFFIGTLVILWSIVVIPVWPISDNRVFASIAESQFHHSADPKLQRGNFGKSEAGESVSEAINRLILNDSETAPGNVLLIGTLDDFDLLCPCVSFGDLNLGLFDRASGEGYESAIDQVRSSEITHIVMDWPSLRSRQSRTGRKFEAAYRAILDRMLETSIVSPLPWEMDSAGAELFRVIPK